MDSNNCYNPGITNIGKKERSRRRRNGWIYLVITVAAFVLMVCLNLSRHYRLLLYLPATMSSLGFLQAKASFCVYYGLKGEYHMDNEYKSVTEKEEISLDRKTSLNILIVALSTGLAVTILAYLFF